MKNTTRSALEPKRLRGIQHAGLKPTQPTPYRARGHEAPARSTCTQRQVAALGAKGHARLAPMHPTVAPLPGLLPGKARLEHMQPARGGCDSQQRVRDSWGQENKDSPQHFSGSWGRGKGEFCQTQALA
eukprot:1157731-Pelagomonas_calceolata.AAC.11